MGRGWADYQVAPRTGAAKVWSRPSAHDFHERRNVQNRPGHPHCPADRLLRRVDRPCRPRRGPRPRERPIPLRVHGCLPARVRGRPADRPPEPRGRLCADLDGHHARPQALRTVDRKPGRIRPSAAGGGQFPALVAQRHAARLHRRRPDPRALDGHRRNRDPDAADRVAERDPLVAGRALHRLQHAGAVRAAEPGRAAEAARRGRMGRSADHGGSLQEHPGRGRVSRLRLQPHLRDSGRRRDTDPGHFG